MSEWIPATEKPLRRDLRTCTQRQDAALNDLFAIVTLLATDVSLLRKRVIALEARPAVTPASYTAAPNQTYTWLPGDAWSQYCAAIDGEDV